MLLPLFFTKQHLWSLIKRTSEITRMQLNVLRDATCNRLRPGDWFCQSVTRSGLQCLGLLSRLHKAIRPVASRAVIHGDTQLRNNSITVLEFLGIDGDGVEFPARVKTERFHFIRELPE